MPHLETWDGTSNISSPLSYLKSKKKKKSTSLEEGGPTGLSVGMETAGSCAAQCGTTSPMGHNGGTGFIQCSLTSTRMATVLDSPEMQGHILPCRGWSCALEDAAW